MSIYYLDAINGNDTNPGTSSEPWKTFARAITHEGYSPLITAGDTIKLRTGIYTTSEEDGSPLFNRYSNSNLPMGNNDGHTGEGIWDWTNPITFQADTGHTPVFKKLNVIGASAIKYNFYYIFDGITITTPDNGDYNWKNGGILFNNTNYIQLNDFKITGLLNRFYYTDSKSTFGIIRINEAGGGYSSNIKISNCNLHEGICGIRLQGKLGDNIIVEDCEGYNLGGHGIRVNNASSVGNTIKIQNNHIYNQKRCMSAVAPYGTMNGGSNYPYFVGTDYVKQDNTNAFGRIHSQGVVTVITGTIIGTFNTTNNVTSNNGSINMSPSSFVPSATTDATISYKSFVTAPIAGDTLTQVTSGATMIVISVNVTSLYIEYKGDTAEFNDSDVIRKCNSEGVIVTSPDNASLTEITKLSEYPTHAGGITIFGDNVNINNNIIHAFGNSGGIALLRDVSMTPRNNITIENNLIYDTLTHYALYIESIGTNMRIINNTIVGWHDVDITGRSHYGLPMYLKVQNGQDGSGMAVYNNIVVGGCTTTEGLTTFVEDYNCFYSVLDVSTGSQTWISAGKGQWKGENTTIITGTVSNESYDTFYESNFFAGTIDVSRGDGSEWPDTADYASGGGYHGKNLNDVYILASNSIADYDTATSQEKNNFQDRYFSVGTNRISASKSLDSKKDNALFPNISI